MVTGGVHLNRRVNSLQQAVLVDACNEKARFIQSLRALS